MNTSSAPMPAAASLNKEKIQQCREESDSLKRLVGYLQAENSYMKTRLVHLANLNISHKISEEGKSLQDDLLKIESIIISNKHLLEGLDKWLTKNDCSAAYVKGTLKRCNHIRKSIEQLEEEFKNQRRRFNTHVIEFI